MRHNLQTKEEEDLKECTFTPKLLRSTTPDAASNSLLNPPTPKGYEESIQRIKMAAEERKRKEQYIEEVSKVRVDKTMYDERGNTIVQPFSFQKRLDRFN